MDVTTARCVERPGSEHNTNSRPEAIRVQAGCLRSGQIGMGFWEAMYFFIKQSISSVLTLSQGLSSPDAGAFWLFVVLPPMERAMRWKPCKQKREKAKERYFDQRSASGEKPIGRKRRVV
jgi:hypothetical protein